MVAGALLGLLGGSVRLGPTPRAVLLIAAGVFVAVLAIRLMRRTGSRTRSQAGGCATSPPRPRRVRGPVGALVLGATTILVPCGVTLSIEVVAVTSGSPPAGALVMAGFVIGSTPALAVLGLLLRRAAVTRFAAVAGVLALVAGLWTVTSGLRLAGWLPELGTRAASAAGVAVRADGVQTITIWATREGYRPAIVALHADTPTEITFQATEDAGCTRSLAIDGRDVALPATVRLPPHPEGRLRYACGMGMYPGAIDFR